MIFAERVAEARGRAEGETLARMQALMTVFAARWFVVNEITVMKVPTCKDTSTLNRWLARAVSATTLDSVFT